MRRPARGNGSDPGPQLSLLLDQADDGFRICTSNRLETLTARLAEEVRRYPADPLDPERIVVPDVLLGQWLRLEMATHLGVAAHLKVQLQAEFAWDAMRETLPDLTGESVFGPPCLRWRIFDHLHAAQDSQAGGLHAWTGDDEISRYLADGDPRKRFELADRLAIAYDRCRVYRPDSIRRWQQDAAEGWHARLWATLAAENTESEHWVDAIDSYRRVLDNMTPSAPRKRVSFFHVAAMSPTYVEVLRLLARVMDVHLYLLSPSRTFWGASPARRRGQQPDDEQPNELLEAWGRSARDLRALLDHQERGLVLASRPTAEDVPRACTCLAAVQRDILGVGPRGEADGHDPRQPDDSIQVHVCHSATREVEVLHDRLLGIFDVHSDIQPADVLIATPDLDTYAPLVKAVFGSAGRIDFQVGTRRLKEGAALTAFLGLLELPGSRYTASDVLAPLLAEAVRAHFGFSDTDLTTIRGAVARSRIRWGIDEDHRTSLDVPASENHNWRRGLDRLVLGYAIEEGNALLDGITPSALDHWGFRGGASDYELLGRFHRYCEYTFALDAWAQAEHDAARWTERLRTEVLEVFFDGAARTAPETVREVNTVARLIDEFDEECRRAGNSGPIPFPVLRDVLRDRAARTARSTPRLAHGVTVAGLASGQIFPAKVMCIVGLNDGVFPGLPQAMPFAFQAALFDGEAREPGDRDRRDEDRFAFLEALLAARRCFVLTCTGRDLQEDKPIPPSVIVTELTEYLEARFPGFEAQRSEPWTTRHPLQPFSRRYFEANEPGLFSFSQPMLAAVEALGAGGEEPRRFEGEVAPEGGGDPPAELELEDLIRLAASPSKDFLGARLGIRLDSREDEVADDEPLDLNLLEAWQLKSDIAGSGEFDDERTIELAAARGLLPTANLGRVQHRQSAAQVEALSEELRGFREHREAPPRAVDVVLGNTRLVGAVDQFHEGRGELLFWRIGGLGAKYRIATWLRLLAMICSREQSAKAILRGSRREVERIELEGPDPGEARSLLGEWIDVWGESRSRPLPFFASTSWAWTSRETWNARVDGMWSGQSFSEGNHPAHRLIFGDDPSGDEFERLARRLLGPLKDATRDERS